MNGLPQFAWVVIAIVLLLVLGTSSPKVGGWLLILLVIGMVALHKQSLTGVGGGGVSF